MADRDDRSVRASPGLITLLIVIVALGPLSMSSFIPALPALREAFAAGAGETQLALTLSMVSIAVTTLIYGPMSDRFGRRPVLVVTLLLGIAGSLMGALAVSLDMVIWGRIVQAAGTASGMVLARAIILDLYPPERMAAVLGNLTAAMVIAPLIGPTLGGLVVEFIGWRGAFFAVAGLAAAVWLATLLLLPETNRRRRPSLNFLGALNDFRGLSQNRDYVRFSLFGVLTQSGFFAFVAGAAFIVQDVYDRPIGEYGRYFTVIPLGFMIGSLTAGRLADRLGNMGLIGLGSIITAVGLAGACAAAIAGLENPYWLFGPLAIGVLGCGLSMPGSQAASIAAAPAVPGSAAGLYGSVQMTAAAAVGQLVGIIQGSTSAQPTIFTMTVLMALAPVALWLIRPIPRAARRRG